VTSPATEVDTEGVTGNTGAAPVGTAATSGKDVETSTAPGAAYGSTTPAPNPPTVSGTFDTEAANGGRLVNSPTSTQPLLVKTLDTLAGGGEPIQDANPPYRAPSLPAPAIIVDTTWTDRPTSDGLPHVPSANNVGGTLETGSIGAVPAPASHNTPPAPSAPTVVAAARGVQVTWVAPTPVSGAPTLGYQIQSDTGGVRYANANQLTKFFDTLTPNQAYKFRVAARNYNGWGAYSAFSSTATPYNPDENDAGKPAPGLTPDNRVNPIYKPDGTVVPGTGGWPTTPKTVAAVQASATTATVTWAAPDYGLPLTNYVVTASTGQTATVSGTTLTATVTGLTTGTAVTFTVKAVNSKGSFTSAPSNSVTPGAPSTPKTVAAAIASATSATVTWAAPDFGLPLTGYTVTPSVGGSPQTVSGTTLTATMTGLTTGTPVTFTVTATNSYGTFTSPASNSITPA
jgi:hypothetical protein